MLFTTVSGYILAEKKNKSKKPLPAFVQQVFGCDALKTVS
jgi:hypothetical protein